MAEPHEGGCLLHRDKRKGMERSRRPWCPRKTVRAGLRLQAEHGQQGQEAVLTRRRAALGGCRQRRPHVNGSAPSYGLWSLWS